MAAFAAYAFAWVKFPLRRTLFILVVGLLVVPLQMALIPVLRLYSGVSLYGTFVVIWLAHPLLGMMASAAAVAALTERLIQPLTGSGTALADTLDAYLDSGGAVSSNHRVLQDPGGVWVTKVSARCGLAEAFGLSTADSSGYRPSIPFASQQAACLSVGRLIAYVLGMPISSSLTR